MSAATYRRLLAAGAPELPEGYFYRIDTVQDREPFGRRVDLARIRIMKRAEAPTKLSVLLNGLFPSLFRHFRYRHEQITSSIFGLGDSSYFENVTDPDNVIPSLAGLAREAWERWIAANAAALAREAALRTVRTLEGDHP